MSIRLGQSFITADRAASVRAETVAETLQHVQQTEPLSPRLLDPSVPRDLETIVSRPGKEPTKRYATAQELARMFRFLRDDQSTRVPSPARRGWRLVRAEARACDFVFS